MPRKSSAGLSDCHPGESHPAQAAQGLPSEVKLLWGDFVASMPADLRRPAD
jgi:hypothetical protein